MLQTAGSQGLLESTLTTSGPVSSPRLGWELRTDLCGRLNGRESAEGGTDVQQLEC